MRLGYYCKIFAHRQMLPMGKWGCGAMPIENGNVGSSANMTVEYKRRKHHDTLDTYACTHIVTEHNRYDLDCRRIALDLGQEKSQDPHDPVSDPCLLFGGDRDRKAGDLFAKRV